MGAGVINIDIIGGNQAGNIAAGNLTITTKTPDAPPMTPELAKLTQDLTALIQQQPTPSAKSTAAQLWQTLRKTAPDVAVWFYDLYKAPLTTFLHGLDAIMK